MDTVRKTLPEYDINKGYIALYEDENQPLKNARLILGFDESTRINVGDKGILFPALELLPEDIMQDLKK
jgi:hypothetical protein